MWGIDAFEARERIKAHHPLRPGIVMTAGSFRTKPLAFAPQTRQRLTSHPRPGNVRVLRNAIERDAIAESLERHDGNAAGVVRALGIAHTARYRTIEKHGLR